LVAVVVIALVATAGTLAVRPWDDGRAAADCSQLQRQTADEAGPVARACGVRVEVASERSPWMTVYANPDGSSHMTVSTLPTRTNVNGEWEDIDTDIAAESGPAFGAMPAHGGSPAGGRVAAARGAESEGMAHREKETSSITSSSSLKSGAAGSLPRTFTIRST
jgi:hypothetical protein